ncbi:hypothetical protein C8F04DRAFT_1093528 [Mycena alexandri]|uniref:Uncharacterized protein n=1 Tax=Mycena alexandri TaxID=1745969 RepID=A0AAD6WRA0_9AGAR|nr:hypothetical protein C8F04DRAFT_1140679 [Mycena alexandri]KAJ7022160.1 hypothetical protein C8F04DRAFT_1138724 [Mycena alexandri]KAJ7022994.1 hypothetical protein C8F04DRAFT_1135995 [Mycena alexandri]KAJ7037101.1 hypothetical protein C8F04DRAFT_1093528 [Mycena alexandri]
MLVRLATCLTPPTSWHGAWALTGMSPPAHSLIVFTLQASPPRPRYIARAHHVACDDSSSSIGRTVPGQCATHVL